MSLDLANTETMGKRLILLRKMAGLTPSLLSEKSRLAYSTLKQWETEFRPISNKGAMVIIDVMRKHGVTCSLQWLLHGVGNPPTFQSEVELTFTSAIPLNFEQEINHFKASNQNHTVLEITDDSMKPYLVYGDTVGGSWLSDFHGESFNKKLCIVCLDDMSILCRWLENTPNENFLGLSTLNPALNNPLNFLNKDRIVKIAPVSHIWKKRH